MLAVALLASATLAQPLTPAVKAGVDGIFAHFDKPGSPGCAVGIVRHGKLIYSRGYGYANLDHAIPITADTVFDIGTASKAFTATAVLLLEQDSKLKLDDNIRKYIPELPDYGTPITIRQMLNHTSGLRDYRTLFSLALYGPEDYYSADEALTMLTHQKALNFTPGGKQEDSNSGYFLTSVLVERLSGKTLRQFAHERIFQPLGMTSTRFQDDHREPVKKRATNYVRERNSTGFSIQMSNLDIVGDRGIHTSLNDLLKWDRNFALRKVGGAELLRQMETGSLGIRAGHSLGYATVTHSSRSVGSTAELLRLTGEGYSVICLCNHAQTIAFYLARFVAANLLNAVLPFEVSNDRFGARPTKTHPVSDYVGTYRSVELDTTYRIAAVDGRLQVIHRNGHSLRLHSTDKFYRESFVFSFIRDATDRVTAFTVADERLQGIRFERIH